jgi:FMN reductase
MNLSANYKPLILGLGGTTRPSSSSERALTLALASAEAAGCEVALLTGLHLQLPLYDAGVSARTAEATKLIELLRQCHGLIIASPGYHGSMSGMMKNALDYIEDMRDDAAPYLEGRAVGCIACAAGWQAIGTTITAMRSVVHALRGWPTPISVGLNTASPLLDEAGRPMDSHGLSQLDLLGCQVVEFAQMRQNFRRHAE